MPGYEGLSAALELRVRNALKIAFNEDAFDDLVLKAGQRITIFTSSSDPHEKRVKLTVRKAYPEGWLIDLVAIASREVPGDPELQAIEVELRATVTYVAPDNPNHFQACCLNGGHIMVDRETLRDALEKLYNPREKRIIVINDGVQPAVPGQRLKTGKTHTRKLIAHLRQVRADFRLVDVDLEEIRDVLAPPKLVMPDDVAASIIRQMKYPQSLLPELPADSQWARWVLKFCDNFAAEAAEDERTSWIVIDSFNVVLVPPETQGLINQLTQRVSDTLGNVRMILVGYNGTLLPTVRAKIDPVKAFEQKHLVEFFSRAFKERNRDFTDDDVADSVVRVLEGADPAQPDFVVKASSLILAELEDH
jgi:hypothetical protein